MKMIKYDDHWKVQRAEMHIHIENDYIQWWLEGAVSWNV
jgi:hypothetical protein